MKKLFFLKDLCWGTSVALAWTWGFGTYFSIQVALAFGLFGLLVFSIPNAFGLAMFGVGTNYLARKLAVNKIDFFNYFLEKAKKYTTIFLAFQFFALSINTFGFIRYVAIPLGYSSEISLFILFIIPIILIGYGRTINIKYIHLVLGVVIFLSVFYILSSFNYSTWKLPMHDITVGLQNTPSIYFFGWCTMTTISFLVAPWLDIQHWQRAIQIKEEKANLSRSYTLGGFLFFLIIFFHGSLALYLKVKGIHFIAEPIMNNISSYRYSVITTLAQYKAGVGDSYLLFLFFIALGGISSSLASLRWYSQDVQQSDQKIKVFFLYILSLIFAWLLAVTRAQLELYCVASFFFIYQYSLTKELFFPPNNLNSKGIFILSVLYTTCFILCESYINVISGIVLILLPVIFLAILVWFKPR